MAFHIKLENAGEAHIIKLAIEGADLNFVAVFKFAFGIIFLVLVKSGRAGGCFIKGDGHGLSFLAQPVIMGARLAEQIIQTKISHQPRPCFWDGLECV